MSPTARPTTGAAEVTADTGLLSRSAQEVPRVGRNDPCPCGSGLSTRPATAS